MYLLKAAASTYARVVRRCRHAFPHKPTSIRPDEFVLLSKNSEDCAPTEPQVQYVAKLLEVRSATALELEEHFPGVGAAERWSQISTLYWPKRLDLAFNLTAVPGFNARRYSTVQGFAKLDSSDELAMLEEFVDWLRKEIAPKLRPQGS